MGHGAGRASLAVVDGLEWGLLIAGLMFASLALADKALMKVRVVDAYLEIRTGPGRGYPVFHVVERGGEIQVLKRKTDWFKVRTARGREGWVDRAQMERTVTDYGGQRPFADKALGDYFRHRIELGITGGIFDSEPVVGVRGDYWVTPNLGLEVGASQVSGRFSSSTLFYGAVIATPFPEARISPFALLGFGRMNNIPDPTLVGRQTRDSNMPLVGLGVRGYLTRNLLLRLDVRDYLALVDDNQDEEFLEYTLGMSFFF